jgi:general L-amino acid transport system substrate-binding protein
MRRIARLAVGLVLATALAGAGTVKMAAAGTLEAVIERGALRCGVGDEPLPGFAVRDMWGEWTGFDVDYCRAIAAAVLGDAEAVRFVPLATVERLPALAEGRVDVLAAATSWTLARDAAGVEFPAVTLYDGEAFLVPRALGVRSALELDGARICVLDDPTTLERLEAFFTTHLMEHVVVVFQGSADLVAAYDAGLCDAAAADRSRLAGGRLRLDEPEAHVLLPELVAKEPLALAVAEGDPAWADVVRWVHMVLLAAEEHGLDRATARTNEAVDAFDRVEGAGGGHAAALGIPAGWPRRAVAAVGHYGELYERHLGPETDVGLDRGLNALWREGGLHYPLPLR